MAKKSIKEKEVISYLKEKGFRELKMEEKNAVWYKKASEHPACLKPVKKKYCHSALSTK